MSTLITRVCEGEPDAWETISQVGADHRPIMVWHVSKLTDGILDTRAADVIRPYHETWFGEIMQGQRENPAHLNLASNLTGTAAQNQ